jgi:hypothetical protein
MHRGVLDGARSDAAARFVEAGGLPARHHLPARPDLPGRVEMHTGSASRAGARADRRHPVSAGSDLRRHAALFARLAMHTGRSPRSGAAEGTAAGASGTASTVRPCYQGQLSVPLKLQHAFFGRQEPPAAAHWVASLGAAPVELRV